MKIPQLLRYFFVVLHFKFGSFYALNALADFHEFLLVCVIDSFVKIQFHRVSIGDQF